MTSCWFSLNVFIFILLLHGLCRLVQEVNDLHAMIQDLRNKLAQEENAIQHLLRTRATLEQDLAVKNNTLHIDQVGCGKSYLAEFCSRMTS